MKNVLIKMQDVLSNKRYIHLVELWGISSEKYQMTLENSIELYHRDPGKKD